MDRIDWDITSKIVFILLLPGFLLMFSCQDVKLATKQELRAYIENPGNGLQKIVQAGGVRVRLTFQPPELMIPDQETKGPDFDRYKDRYFFILGFSKDEKELLRQLKYADYSELIRVFSFRMQEYITISGDDDGDPVQPEDCIFQQTYGMAEENRLLLVFDKEKIKQTRRLKLRLNECGLGIGNLYFTIDAKDINGIPKLSI